MRENVRLRQQSFEVSLGVKQVAAVLVAALLLMGAVFALGLSLGRRSGAGPQQPLAAPRDALARLDDPLLGKEEPPPELKAHQALTDSRSIDKTMPVPAVIAPRGPGAAARAEEKSTHEPGFAMPPAIADQAPISAPARAGAALLDTPAAAASPAPPPIAPMEVAVPAAPPPQPQPQPAVRQSERENRQPSHAVSHSRPGQGSAGAFTIQVASTQHRADAERLARRLAARKPRIVAADLPGRGRWYRVQVGSFETRESARLALASMSGVHGIVTPAR
jgi:DedD protein